MSNIFRSGGGGGGLFGRRHRPEPSRPHNEVFDPFHHPDFTSALGKPHMAFSSAHETSSMVNSKIEWKETPEAHVYKANLPGLKHNEVKVEVEDDRVICISGERMVEKEENRGQYYMVERSSGHFVQRFSLPENADTDRIKAQYEYGVLTITVPKHRVSNPYSRRPVTVYGN